jgi:hypothetical protein
LIKPAIPLLAGPALQRDAARVGRDLRIVYVTGALPPPLKTGSYCSGADRQAPLTAARKLHGNGLFIGQIVT